MQFKKGTSQAEIGVVDCFDREPKFFFKNFPENISPHSKKEIWFTVKMG